MGFNYKPSADPKNKTVLISDMFTKRKASQPVVDDDLRRANFADMRSPKGETISNRFYDTFTKF